MKPKVNWLSHSVAPYRVPVWRSIQSDYDLEVQCLTGPNRAENRGDDWDASRYPDLRIRMLRTTPLRVLGAALPVRLRRNGERSEADCDVLLLGGWEAPVYLQAFLSARMRRKPVVGFYESIERTGRFRRGVVPVVRAWLFRRMQAVVVPGSAAKAAVARMGVRQERIFEGFNAVDTEAMRRAHSIRAEGRRTMSGSQGHRFVYVGQLIPRKRVIELIDAYLSVRADGDTLTIVGTGVLERTIRELFEDELAAGHVELRGHVDNEVLPDVLADMQTLCLVSSEEVWGLVVNEALAAGLHVVVSRSCGVADSVKGMPGVLLVDERLRDLPRVLMRAKDSWHGWIEDPPILRLGPSEFAATFSAAFDAVLAR